MRIILTAAIAALALGGCKPATTENAVDNVAEANAVEANAVGEGNAVGNATGNVSAQVLAMSDRERNVVLVRAIMDANLPCDGVTRSERLPDQGGLPTWRATCMNGTSHIVTITPDGTANIVSRAGR